MMADNIERAAIGIHRSLALSAMSLTTVVLIYWDLLALGKAIE